MFPPTRTLRPHAATDARSGRSSSTCPWSRSPRRSARCTCGRRPRSRRRPGRVTLHRARPPTLSGTPGESTANVSPDDPSSAPARRTRAGRFDGLDRVVQFARRLFVGRVDGRAARAQHRTLARPLLPRPMTRTRSRASKRHHRTRNHPIAEARARPSRSAPSPSSRANRRVRSDGAAGSCERSLAARRLKLCDLHDHRERLGDEDAADQDSSSISPSRIATPESTAPSASEPVSPMNIFAGCRL